MDCSLKSIQFLLSLSLHCCMDPVAHIADSVYLTYRDYAPNHKTIQLVSAVAFLF